MTDQLAVHRHLDSCATPTHEFQQGICSLILESNLTIEERPACSKHKDALRQTDQNGPCSVEYALSFLGIASATAVVLGLLRTQLLLFWEQTLEPILFWSVALFRGPSPIEQIDNARTLGRFVTMLLVIGLLALCYLESQRVSRMQMR